MATLCQGPNIPTFCGLIPAVSGPLERSVSEREVAGRPNKNSEQDRLKREKKQEGEINNRSECGNSERHGERYPGQHAKVRFSCARDKSRQTNKKICCTHWDGVPEWLKKR